LAQLVSATTGLSQADAEKRVCDVFEEAQQSADRARKALASVPVAFRGPVERSILRQLRRHDWGQTARSRKGIGVIQDLETIEEPAFKLEEDFHAFDHTAATRCAHPDSHFDRPV
jgi:hypothetical protein